jgi:hypothetical protein
MTMTDGTPFGRPLERQPRTGGSPEPPTGVTPSWRPINNGQDPEQGGSNLSRRGELRQPRVEPELRYSRLQCNRGNPP